MMLFYALGWESRGVEIGNDGEEGRDEEWESHV